MDPRGSGHHTHFGDVQRQFQPRYWDGTVRRLPCMANPRIRTGETASQGSSYYHHGTQCICGTATSGDFPQSPCSKRRAQPRFSVPAISGRECARGVQGCGTQDRTTPTPSCRIVALQRRSDSIFVAIYPSRCLLAKRPCKTRPA
jgi:hypothetical protein